MASIGINSRSCLVNSQKPIKTAHCCHATSHCLVYDGNKRLSSSAGLHRSGSEQRVSLILKHSAGCIKQNALYKVMGDIYSTLLSTNDIPAGVLSSLGATTRIAINPPFPIYEQNSGLYFSRELIADECITVFRSTMASNSPRSQAVYDEKTSGGVALQRVFHALSPWELHCFPF